MAGMILECDYKLEGKDMEIRYSPDPVRFSRMTTQEIRDNFLVSSLFKPDEIAMVYQDPQSALNPALRVGKQIAEVVRTHDALEAADARQRALGLPALCHCQCHDAQCQRP